MECDNRIETCFACPCCEARSNVLGFHKIMHIEGAGLIVYLYNDGNEGEGNGESFVLHNTKSKDIRVLDVIPDMENVTPNCERCIKILEHSKKLLRTVPDINGNDVIGLCDHCRYVAEMNNRCSCCQKRVNRFHAIISENENAKLLDTTKLLVSNKSAIKFKKRSYSDFEINKITKKTCEINHVPEIKQMFQRPHPSVETSLDSNPATSHKYFSEQRLGCTNFLSSCYSFDKNHHKAESERSSDYDEKKYKVLNRSLSALVTKESFQVSSSKIVKENSIMKMKKNKTDLNQPNDFVIKREKDQNMDHKETIYVGRRNLDTTKTFKGPFALKEISSNIISTRDTTNIDSSCGLPSFDNITEALLYIPQTKEETKRKKLRITESDTKTMEMEYLSDSVRRNKHSQLFSGNPKKELPRKFVPNEVSKKIIRDRTLDEAKHIVIVDNTKDITKISSIQHNKSFTSLQSIPDDYIAVDLEYFFPKKKVKKTDAKTVTSLELVFDINEKLQKKTEEEALRVKIQKDKQRDMKKSNKIYGSKNDGINEKTLKKYKVPENSEDHVTEIKNRTNRLRQSSQANKLDKTKTVKHKNDHLKTDYDKPLDMIHKQLNLEDLNETSHNSRGDNKDLEKISQPRPTDLIMDSDMNRKSRSKIRPDSKQNSTLLNQKQELDGSEAKSKEQHLRPPTGTKTTDGKEKLGTQQKDVKLCPNTEMKEDEIFKQLLKEKEKPKVKQKLKDEPKGSLNKMMKQEIEAPKLIELQLDRNDSDFEEDENLIRLEDDFSDIIIGEKIVKLKTQNTDKNPIGESIIPLMFEFTYKDDLQIIPTEDIVVDSMDTEANIKVRRPVLSLNPSDQQLSKGITRYALSDRAYIEKGWTMLPTEKVVRKMNVYRMRPAHPEFDWFEHNKNKQPMMYDTGEKLAEFEDNGRGRWYYRNGRLALDYYDATESNAQQRFVVYSSGEPDERGRTHPITVLATFDYLGNGVVFDHRGKIRLKYNQTEGVVLDRSIGPVSHWKWHTLNDPPVLQQVMIDTQMAHKDPDILKLVGPNADKPRPDNEEMLAIEFDNFIREKSKKLSQKFKPFQIKMKAMKINENFSLRILDQASVYLIFRDGTTNLKLNIGMLLDHKEIVDTDTAEVGEVSCNVERFPAKTDSLAGLQKSVAHAQVMDRSRVVRDQRIRPTVAIASADQLVAASTRGLQPRHPLKNCPSSTISAVSCDINCKIRKPSTTNLYYNTQII